MVKRSFASNTFFDKCWHSSAPGLFFNEVFHDVNIQAVSDACIDVLLRRWLLVSKVLFSTSSDSVDARHEPSQSNNGSDERRSVEGPLQHQLLQECTPV